MKRKRDTMTNLKECINMNGPHDEQKANTIIIWGNLERQRKEECYHTWKTLLRNIEIPIDSKTPAYFLDCTQFSWSWVIAFGSWPCSLHVICRHRNNSLCTHHLSAPSYPHHPVVMLYLRCPASQRSPDPIKVITSELLRTFLGPIYLRDH